MKAALVTGASKGIGYACAERLQRDGYAVFVCARSSDEIEEAVGRLSKNGRAAGAQADMGLVEDCRRVVEECVRVFGRIDALVNNAGIYHPVPLIDMPPEAWDETFNVNARGPLVVGVAAAHHMREQGDGGHIVNMASSNGVMAESQFAHYNASKAALISLTKTMAIEWGEYGIQVNAIAPAWIYTPLSEPWIGALTEEQLERYFPARRIGDAEEVAELAAFLCRDGCSYLTGETIKVDGGMLALHPCPY
jgi:NAD(P)-dependent dehydrogenase (short-subunit alcohol dehydrogenase family)